MAKKQARKNVDAARTKRYSKQITKETGKNIQAIRDRDNAGTAIPRVKGSVLETVAKKQVRGYQKDAKDSAARVKGWKDLEKKKTTQVNRQRAERDSAIMSKAAWNKAK